MRRTAASGTGSGRKRRSARWVSTTVKKSSGATPAAAPRRAWSPPPSRTGHAYGRSTGLDKPRQPRVSRLLARRLERGLDLRRAEPVPVREEAALPGPELEGVAEQRLGAEDTQPLPPRGDEAARVLVEGPLQEAQRQRPPLEIVGGQVADQLAGPARDRRVEPVVAADELGRGELVAGLLDVDAIRVVAAQPHGGWRRDGVLLGRVEVVRSALGERRHDRGRRARGIRFESDLLIRPMQQGRAAAEQREYGRQEERFPSHGLPPAGPPDRRQRLLLAAVAEHRVLEGLRDREANLLARGNLDGLAGLRVAPHARLHLAQAEDAEARDLDRFALLHGLDHGIDDGRENLVDLLAAGAGPFGEFRHQLCLRHQTSWGGGERRDLTAPAMRVSRKPTSTK